MNGKRILIVGGGSGIGFCLAEKLMALGACVTLASRDSAKIHNAVVDLFKYERVTSYLAM